MPRHNVQKKAKEEREKEKNMNINEHQRKKYYNGNSKLGKSVYVVWI